MANDVLAKMAVKLSAKTQEFDTAFNRSQKNLNSFNKTFSSLAKVAGGLFVADKMIAFGREVFNVTAEFQKFEAVLTNTLGNNGAANAALAQITEFAAKTPYQVNELTGSFVKLANQGFVPTLNEMRSLGDLASAMGKSFDQLTEAIIDAQTGEFERLKEFGIRASKQGDKVTFTFKGVKTQVDFTADSIRQYILSLGQVEGVTGGMEAQSKTLGGGLSNLADSWEQLTLSIGKAAESGGLFSKTLDLISEGVKGLKGLFDVGESREELEATIAFFQAAVQRYDMEGNNNAWQMAIEALDAAQKKLKALTDGEQKLAEIQNNKTKPSTDGLTMSVKQLMDQWDRQNSIFGGSQFNAADQIKPKTGADFLFDSGVMSEMANAGANALRTLDTALTINSNSWDVWWSGVQARTQQFNEAMELHKEKTERLAEVSQTVGAALGDVFSSIATGQEDLVHVMSRATEQIITMFLQQSIAGMIAAAIKDPSTPFPFAKIAIAAAGIAAVKGMFSAIGGASGGGGGSRTAPGILPSAVGKSESKIKGYDIYINQTKDSYRRSRMG